MTLTLSLGGLIVAVDVFGGGAEDDDLLSFFGQFLLYALIWLIGSIWMFIMTFYVYENGNIKEDYDSYMLLNKKCPKCTKKLPSYMTKKCPHCTADL